MKHINFNGMQVISDPNLVVEDGEDWSQVRSPARARRRRKRGFPQRIRIRYKPDSKVYVMGGRMVMHPEIAAELQQHVDAYRLIQPGALWSNPLWPR